MLCLTINETPRVTLFNHIYYHNDWLLCYNDIPRLSEANPLTFNTFYSRLQRQLKRNGMIYYADNFRRWDINKAKKIIGVNHRKYQLPHSYHWQSQTGLYHNSFKKGQ